MTLADRVREDVGYALRGFRRHPGVSLLAVLILALGIGANTAVFSLVNPILLRPLPVADADRLVWIANTGTRGMSGVTFRVDWYEEFARHSTSFEAMAPYFAFSGFFSRTMTEGAVPERLAAADVGPGFLELLGVTPQAGRLFTGDDHRGPTIKGILLTDAFWRRRFNADPAVVGRTVTINNAAVPVVGVLPGSFDFSSIFTPGVAVDVIFPADLEFLRPLGNTIALVGRLRPGVTVDQARAEFATLLPTLREQRPALGAVGVNLTDLRTHVSGGVRQSLLVLWAAVGVVLLIVCANVTNLLLARASSRRREFAVRGALGADRRRLFQQVLTEGLLLSGAGALLGAPLAYGITLWVTQGDAVSVPLLHYARVDIVALAVTVVVAVVTGIAGSVVPAVRLSGQSPQTALTEQGRGTVDSAAQTWIRRVLVVAEVALAAVLLVGAGLLGRSFLALLDVDLGFEPAGATAARIEMPTELSPPQRNALVREIRQRVQAMPGVEAAGFTDALPLDRNRTWGVVVPGVQYPPGTAPSAFVYIVSPGYLTAMGIRVIAGRDLLDGDPIAPRHPAIINRALAEALYPGEDPIGRPAMTNGRPLTIVGVVDDVRQARLDERPVNQLYLDMARGGAIGSDLIVRGAPEPPAAGALRTALREVDARVALTETRTVGSLVDRSVSPLRFLVELIAGFSTFALVLACLGLYGVVSYHVGQRTAEIGVRMALGATAAEVRRQIVLNTLALAGTGVAIGGVAALLLSRVVEALLFATSPRDPWVFAGTAAVLVGVAALAGLVPAIRASRIDPARALRAE